LQPVSSIPSEIVEQRVVAIGTRIVVLLAIVEQAGTGAKWLTARERPGFSRVVVASVISATCWITHGRTGNNAAYCRVEGAGVAVRRLSDIVVQFTRVL